MTILYIQTLYIHPVPDCDGHPTSSSSHLAMNTEKWTFKFTRQLHEQWPRVDQSDLEHLAGSLQAEDTRDAGVQGPAMIDVRRQKRQTLGHITDGSKLRPVVVPSLAFRLAASP